MNATHPTAKFLHQHRRRARGTLLVWSLVVTFATAAFMGAVHLGWTARGIEWALLPIAVATATLVRWLQQAPRLTPHRLAHELDVRWQLRAHLETAVELAGDDSPLAKVQRDDATLKLAGKKPPGAVLWFSGLFAVTLVLFVLGLEGTALALRALQKPPAPKVVATEVKTPASPEAPLPPLEFHAAIEWQSPDSEIKATAIEEIPLVAIANSVTGLKNVSLEMVVNGDRELSRPLDPAAAGESQAPGAHELTPSLYLDELDLKVGDIVSYRLVAELNTPTKQTVTSPPQFIEIRKTQRDSELKAGELSPLAVLLLELKGRQLQLLKQNFTLTQLAAAPNAGSSWNRENDQVATEQDVVATRTGDLLPLLRDVNAPAAALAQAKEAQSLMREASKQIASKENESAAKLQGRALAILTDLSKHIRKALSGPTAPVSDPFKDAQTFKLVPRSETPAGELEQLAERQEKNNARMEADSGAAAKTEQEAIARAAEKIGNGAGLDPLTQAALAAGTKAAAEAAEQLRLGDPAAARVPAAAAQRAFEAAVAAQDQAGRASAAADLDQLRRTLNAASRASPAERAQQLGAVRNALRTAATEQQRTGSADAARELAQLVALATATKPTPEGAREIAVAAAQVQVAMLPRNAAVSRAVRLLNRAGNNSPAAALGDMEIASQEAQWLSPDASTVELAKQVGAQTDALQRAGSRPPARDLVENAAKLAAALDQGPGRRDELVRRFNPADVDPAYRTAVETYFERLSRDARPASRTPAQK